MTAAARREIAANLYRSHADGCTRCPYDVHPDRSPHCPAGLALWTSWAAWWRQSIHDMTDRGWRG